MRQPSDRSDLTDLDEHCRRTALPHDSHHSEHADATDARNFPSTSAERGPQNASQTPIVPETDPNRSGIASPETGPVNAAVSDTETVTVAAHQPNYLPWLGYLHKLHRCDVFVLLDDVEYTSGSWINRNRIKTPDGWTWLTVPVRDTGGPIADVTIADDTGWRADHRKSFQQNYGKAAAFEEFEERFADVYEREWESLYALNTELLRRLVDRLGIDCTFVRSSDIGVDATDCKRIVELCRAVGADRYLSGTGARSYLEQDRFDEAGIDLAYQSLDHPEYEQRFDDFVPELSAVDAVLNLGADRTMELVESLDDR
ncbi:WbqC family protein [Halobacteria archaeon AArc-dxtr1]|nr:WbqC family protein [Halobacteria archaeon AArc-dxtr1]